MSELPGSEREPEAPPDAPALRRRIVFTGAYGLESAGDDAPLLALTSALRRAFPEVRFDCTVLARHADPLIERLAGARFLPNPEHESREAARGRWFRGLNPGDASDERRDLARVESEIRAADLVVAGAGNLLTDLTIDVFRGPIPLLGLYSFLADLHRTPLFLYGISAGPLATRHGRDLSAWIARRAVGVTVRDPGSRDLLESLAPEVEASLLPDPALGLEPADDEAFERALASEGIPRRGARPRLALALRDLEFLGWDRSVVIETLRRLAPDWEFLFVPQCTYADCDDRREAAAVLRALPGAVAYQVRARHAPAVTLRFYETAAVTLAVRLHGAVFSAMRGTPVVALAYLPKVQGFLERIGRGRACHELASATPDKLVPAIQAARGERVSVAPLSNEFGDYVRRIGDLLELATDARKAQDASGKGAAPRLGDAKSDPVQIQDSGRLLTIGGRLGRDSFAASRVGSAAGCARRFPLFSLPRRRRFSQNGAVPGRRREVASLAVHHSSFTPCSTVPSR